MNEKDWFDLGQIPAERMMPDDVRARIAVRAAGSPRRSGTTAAVALSAVAVTAVNASRAWLNVDGQAQDPAELRPDPTEAVRDSAPAKGGDEELADCLRSTDLPVVDAGDWTPGASGELGDTPIRVWRYGTLLAVCAAPGGEGRTHLHVVEKGRPGTTTDPDLATSKDVGASEQIFYDFGPYGGGQASDTVAMVAAGLPERAATVELTRSLSDERLSTPVVNDTFVLTGVDLNAGGLAKDPSELTFRDDEGQVLARVGLGDL